MSAHGAAAAVGCCCRPTEGCRCDDPARPGAAVDASLSSIAASLDVSLAHTSYDNVVSGPCPGEPCYCAPDFVVADGTWGYQKRGSSVDPDADCYGPDNTPIACPKNTCGSCSLYRIGAVARSSVLERDPRLSAVAFATRMTATRQHTFGNWSWFPQRAGFCQPDGSGIRVRKYCAFPYGVSGGETPSATVDPNGQYIDGLTGQYTNGRWGPDIVRVSAVLSISVIYEAWQCAYAATASISYMSLASIRDTVADSNGFPPIGSEMATWIYLKPCRSATDSVLGTYVLSTDTPAKVERYTEFQPCGRSHAYDSFLATAGAVLTLS